jgi:WD40 repeat protein
VRNVAYSPDGNALVSSDDSGLRIWSAESGRPLVQITSTARILDVKYSPDGQHLVTGSSDPKVRVWNASDGTLKKELIGHTKAVNAAAFSADGKYVITGSDDRTAIIWNTTTWTIATVLSTTWTQPLLSAVAYAPDGLWVATGHKDGSMRLWQLASRPDGGIRATLAVTLTGHTDQITSLAFQAHSSYLASSSMDKTVRFWNVSTRSTVQQPLTHGGYVYSVAFSPDGRYMATGAGDYRVRLWDTARFPNEPAKLIVELEGHTDTVLEAMFSPDGRILASSSSDNSVRRYLVRFEDVWEMSKTWVTRPQDAGNPSNSIKP